MNRNNSTRSNESKQVVDKEETNKMVSCRENVEEDLNNWC